MDPFASDVFRDEAEHLHTRRRHLDFLFDILLAGVETPRQFTAHLQRKVLVFNEFDTTEDHDAAEGVGPAAFVAHALIDDRERRTAVFAQCVDLVAFL